MKPAAIALFVALAAALYLGRDVRGPSARLQLDAPYYHVYLVSLIGDGDLDLADEYAITGNYEQLGEVDATGRPANHFPIGTALFSAPFYALGALAAAVAGADTSGFGDLHVKLTLLASPFFTAASLIFLARLVRRRVAGGWIAVAAGVAVLLAGPAVYYAARQPGSSHPVAIFLTAWFLDAWDAASDRPRTWRTWVGLGALLGAMALARPQLVLWGVALVPAAVEDLRRRAWPALVAGAAAAVAAFAPQLLAWHAIYGRWLLVPQGPDFMVWEAPRWSEVLFSSRNGLFAWSPLYAVAAVGLILAARRLPRVAVPLLAGVALQVVANGAVWDWWGGPSFGARRFDSCVPAFALGLAWLLARSRPTAAVVAAASLACAVGNVRGALATGVWDLMTSGGRPMREVFSATQGAALGRATGALSWVATLPARAAFAWRHGTDLAAYDVVVGTHFTTEYFPGLGGHDRRLHIVRLAGDEPFLLGFERTRAGARMRDARARVLVPLNKRTGPIHLRIRTRAADTHARAVWDGRELSAEHVRHETRVALDPVERGVHTLELEAPAGTTIFELVFEIPPGIPP